MESSEQYYSRTWETASQAYGELGFYKWCIERIPNGTHILEIGTGIGIATLALLEAAFIVSSLEENLYNFEKAKKRLSDSGKNVNFLPSIKTARQYFGENNLIKSNFIIDWGEVVNTIKYDTVICWFVGVHQTAHENHDMIKLGYNKRDFGHYRELIYDRIFQVISLKLPVGGVISLVERVGALTSEQMAEEIKLFDNDYDLGAYGLKIEKIEQLAIGDMSLLPGIKMVAVKGGALSIEEEKREAILISYTIIKYRVI